MAERRGLSPAVKTFLWMGAFSVVTLLLGGLREFVIARDLRASGAADLFFRGLAIVGACRNFGTALFRARWVPIGPGVSAATLLRRELIPMVFVGVAALGGLVVFVGDDLSDPTVAVFAIAVVLSIFGAAVRALAERAGLEREGYVLEWALPLGTIAGALLIGRGAFGPTVGITCGLAVGVAVLAPTLFLGSKRTASQSTGKDAPGLTRWLLVDTLAYVNLGLLDAGLSPHIFDEGGFALLTYGYLFVNAALAVPTAAATVVALRISAGGDASAHRKLRKWALLSGLVVAVGVAGTWALLGWHPIASTIDQAAGWKLTEGVRPVVLLAIPFASLRLANTVGRQFQVANDPRRLLPWDFAGLAGRTVLLVVGAQTIGILASPIAVALAELVQLGAWIRVPGGKPRAPD